MYEYHDIKKPGAMPAILFKSINDYYEGTIWHTHQGYHLQIVKYIDEDNIQCIFIETGNEINTNMEALKRRTIANPYHRNRYDAYFGDGKYHSKREYKKIYRAWVNITYKVKLNQMNQDNQNEVISLCDDWYNYQNFAQWYDDYIKLLNPKYIDEYKINKNVLQLGQKFKIYSPATCSIIPAKISYVIDNLYKERIIDNLPRGIGYGTYMHKSYIVNINIDGKCLYLGTFGTPEEAFAKYKEVKEKYIKDIADFYYKDNAILKNAYDALYSIDIKPYL